MKNWHSFILGSVLTFGTLFSCATTGAWIWPYYATQMPSSCYDQGTLMGPASGAWPDLALDTCKPDPIPSGSPSPGPSPVLLKCMTVKVDDFYAAKADDEKCHSDLIACQKACPGL